MTAAILVGVLVAGGAYLVLQREVLRVVLGFVLLGHAVHVLFLAAGGMARSAPPLVGTADPDAAADPLPQAFVLTAVVISFGITVYLLALLRAGGPEQPPDREAPGQRPDADHPPEQPTEQPTQRPTEQPTNPAADPADPAADRAAEDDR